MQAVGQGTCRPTDRSTPSLGPDDRDRHRRRTTSLLQGLQAKTLIQRIARWRPFKRWLEAQHGQVWPTCAEQILEYFEVRQQKGAARSV